METLCFWLKSEHRENPIKRIIFERMKICYFYYFNRRVGGRLTWLKVGRFTLCRVVVSSPREFSVNLLDKWHHYLWPTHDLKYLILSNPLISKSALLQEKKSRIKNCSKSHRHSCLTPPPPPPPPPLLSIAVT